MKTSRKEATINLAGAVGRFLSMIISFSQSVATGVSREDCINPSAETPYVDNEIVRSGKVNRYECLDGCS